MVIDGPFEEVLKQINRNMRCIEIDINVICLRRPEQINRNMRCIEILQYFEVSYLNNRMHALRAFYCHESKAIF